MMQILNFIIRFHQHSSQIIVYNLLGSKSVHNPWWSKPNIVSKK